MRVMLINPSFMEYKFDFVVPHATYAKGILPPLGLISVATYLKKSLQNEVNVMIIEPKIYKTPLNTIKEKLEEFSPQILGISSYSMTHYATTQVAQMAKSVSPEIYINVGGPNTSIFPEEVLYSPYIDSITIGEGEFTFFELVKAKLEKRDLSEIRGIMWKDKGRIIANPSREVISNLDTLPFPDRTLIPFKNYFTVFGRAVPTTTIMGSRGCPYSCSFCTKLRKKVIFRSAANIVNELEYCNDLGYQHFEFYDDVLNISNTFLSELCDEIIRRKLKITWSFHARVNPLPYDLASKLKQAGVYMIKIGVESGSERILRLYKKKIDLNILKDMIKTIKSLNIKTTTFFIMGAPNETEDDIKKSAELVRELQPDYIQFTGLGILPGTEIYNLAIKEGIISENYYPDYVKRPYKDFKIKYWEKGLSETQLSKWFLKVYLSFYFSPKYLIRSFFSLDSFADFKIKFKGGIILFTFMIKFLINYIKEKLRGKLNLRKQP